MKFAVSWSSAGPWVRHQDYNNNLNMVLGRGKSVPTDELLVPQHLARRTVNHVSSAASRIAARAIFASARDVCMCALARAARARQSLSATREEHDAAS
jgi:hypothetical protein